MHPTTDPVLDADLQAYVDDQLEITRRIVVEDYLSRHPEVAAQVMADLRTRDALRVAIPPPPGPAPRRMLDAARRLERGLMRDRLIRRFRRVAAIGVFVAAGWLAHAEYGTLGVARSTAAPAGAPAFVEDAVMSHRTALVRAAMVSQPRAPSFDPEEIRAATRIVIPTLPQGWQVLDVQIFPSEHGPSVEMALDTNEFGRLSLFAVRPGGFGIILPTVATHRGQTVAYWQLGEIAYALTGEADRDALDRAAETLSRRND